MHNIITAFTVGYMLAQTCIISAPTAPPRPTGMVILPPAIDGGSITLPDGGTFACVGYANTATGVPPQLYGTTAAKCKIALGMSDQMAAVDNGWNDGGTP